MDAQPEFTLSAEQPAPRLTANDMPQARYMAHGASGLSDCELLTMLLQGAQNVDDAFASAAKLLSAAGSLLNLARWTPTDFVNAGVPRLKAFQLATLAEIGRRMLSSGEQPLLNRADLVFAHMNPLCITLDVEKFWVLCLNRKNRLMKLETVSSGTATAALAHPREVCRAAIRESATAIICVHNHPSGDPAPSAADLHLTRQLREAAKAVDIDLIDHVIIGRAGADPRGTGFYSFREAGIL